MASKPLIGRRTTLWPPPPPPACQLRDEPATSLQRAAKYASHTTTKKHTHTHACAHTAEATTSPTRWSTSNGRAEKRNEANTRTPLLLLIRSGRKTWEIDDTLGLPSSSPFPELQTGCLGCFSMIFMQSLWFQAPRGHWFSYLKGLNFRWKKTEILPCNIHFTYMFTRVDHARNMLSVTRLRYSK